VIVEPALVAQDTANCAAFRTPALLVQAPAHQRYSGK
jgi:hypothetical protein